MGDDTMNPEAAKIVADEETSCVIEGDCLAVMPTMDDACVDAIVTDPPYGLDFMGKGWDHGVPGEAYWREALRVAKPGCMMLAFGGTRTVHRLTCAIEDAGWEIRDRLLWMYGCLSEDTEIMVDGRWEPYHKAIAGRHALCYNAEHGTYSWQPIQDLYVYDYCDTAFRIQSDSTDQVVSRSHRCLVERGGRYMFQLAEEAAREHQASVPVLEGLQGLLDDLPVPRRGTGNTKKDVQPVLCCDHSEEAAEQNADGRTGRHEAGYLPGVRPEGLETASVVESRCQADVFSAVQRGLSGQGICQARPQGPGGMDGEVRGIIQSQDERRKQSSMEGRGDVLSEAWQLQANQVCTLPEAVPPHGTQGRLCYGAPVVGCSGHRAGPEENRSGASYRPRSAEQCLEQPATLCVESGAQTVRGARYTRASLARITPVFYRGIVWCVRVPTGAFVARRNGKVFVTGNSGFPKSLDISKAIDKAAGAEREVVGATRLGAQQQSTGKYGAWGDGITPTAPATDAAKRWAGWGTALKPAYESIILAMKPCDGTFAHNALTHGVAGLNVDGCRIDGIPPSVPQPEFRPNGEDSGHAFGAGVGRIAAISNNAKGRWPANVILDEDAGAMLDEQSGEVKLGGRHVTRNRSESYGGAWPAGAADYPNDTGGASRFFYSAKATKDDRNSGLSESNTHPTVKPTELMRYLCRLVTPPNGVILDPFCGSGSTGKAARRERFRFIGIELEAEYVEIARLRIGRTKPRRQTFF